MRSLKFLFLPLSFFFLSGMVANGQPAEKRMSKQEYIKKWKDQAIRQMHQHGIPASITLAQGILESGFGNSPLARYANNHFGIKCNGWEGGKFYEDDDRKDECFRKYFSAAESYEDHSEFLANRSRYDFLFELRPTDYKGWAYGLKKAGYATNPRYPRLLIRIIEENELHQYDEFKKMAEHQEKVPKEEEDQLETTVHVKQRKVREHPNDIEFILVRKNDSYARIEKEFNVRERRLRKYNDLNPTDRLRRGDTLYLQPKRNRARQEFHVAQKGETMWEISQKYGVKLDKLYKKNNMIPGTNPEPGQKIHLRARKRDNNSPGFFERLFSSNSN